MFGKNGQVGGELNGDLQRLGNVVALSSAEADFTRPSSLADIISREKPDVIINAAAYTDVENCEDERELAFAVNAQAPEVIAKAAADAGAMLVHFSTDYVFDGCKSSPYSEDDATAPLNVYGESKLAGERAILDSGCRHLIFRLCWVYSGRQRNFLLSILKNLQLRDELNVVDDQHGSPTCASDIATAVTAILAGATLDQEKCGLYHLSSTGDATWYDFAQLIYQTMQDAVGAEAVRCKRINPVPSTEYVTKARRPAFSHLDTGKICDTFGVSLPDWKEAFQRFARSHGELFLPVKPGTTEG